jgi:hypothetical protein
MFVLFRSAYGQRRGPDVHGDHNRCIDGRYHIAGGRHFPDRVSSQAEEVFRQPFSGQKCVVQRRQYRMSGHVVRK